jgi:hypothetical protein
MEIVHGRVMISHDGDVVAVLYNPSKQMIKDAKEIIESTFGKAHVIYRRIVKEKK